MIIATWKQILLRFFCTPHAPSGTMISMFASGLTGGLGLAALPWLPPIAVGCPDNTCMQYYVERIGQHAAYAVELNPAMTAVIGACGSTSCVPRPGLDPWSCHCTCDKHFGFEFDRNRCPDPIVYPTLCQVCDEIASSICKTQFHYIIFKSPRLRLCGVVDSVCACFLSSLLTLVCCRVERSKPSATPHCARIVDT